MNGTLAAQSIIVSGAPKPLILQYPNAYFGVEEELFSSLLKVTWTVVPAAFVSPKKDDEAMLFDDGAIAAVVSSAIDRSIRGNVKQ